MKQQLKSLILKFIPKTVSNFIFYNHATYKNSINSYTSFSQEGEDMILRKVFSNVSNGTYVDIGAHHPALFSNTNYFYLNGWTGINVEPIPGSKQIFDANRPKDTNLELLIAAEEGLTDFYLFDPSLMNTMSEQQAEYNKKFEWCKFIGTKKIHSMPLGKVLDNYLPANTKINFMSIDVEGAELGVLKSNNWVKYSPEVLVVEFIDTGVDEIMQTPAYTFLTDLQYIFFAKTGNSVFFKKDGAFNV